MKKHPNTYQRMVTFCADCDETLDECMCEDDENEPEPCPHKWRVAVMDTRFERCAYCGEVRRAQAVR